MSSTPLTLVDLIWKVPDKYRKHVATSEPFHTGMNYMCMVTGHKYWGSAYAEIPNIKWLVC